MPHFCRVLSKLVLLKCIIDSIINELNCSPPLASPYLLVQVHNTFKCLYFGLTFQSDWLNGMGLLKPLSPPPPWLSHWSQTQSNKFGFDSPNSLKRVFRSTCRLLAKVTASKYLKQTTTMKTILKGEWSVAFPLLSGCSFWRTFIWLKSFKNTFDTNVLKTFLSETTTLLISGAVSFAVLCLK